jgi:hypothetical protein
MRSDTITVVLLTLEVACDILQCTGTNSHWRFGVDYYLHLQNRSSHSFRILRSLKSRQKTSSKYWWLFTNKAGPYSRRRDSSIVIWFHIKLTIAMTGVANRNDCRGPVPSISASYLGSSVFKWGRESSLLILLRPSRHTPVQPGMESRLHRSSFLIPCNFSRKVSGRGLTTHPNLVLTSFRRTPQFLTF